MRKSGRSHRGGRSGSGGRPSRSSLACDAGAGQDDTLGASSSLPLPVGPTPHLDSSLTEGGAPVSRLLEMIWEEVKQQLSIWDADRQPSPSHAVSSATTITASDTVPSFDSG